MIVFFDGSCGLCNRAVRWLWKRTGQSVAFAPLQGITSEKQVPEHHRKAPLKSLVVWDGNETLIEMNGLGALADELPFPWRALMKVATFPVILPFSNMTYRLISRYRSHWPGDNCQLLIDQSRMLP